MKKLAFDVSDMTAERAVQVVVWRLGAIRRHLYPADNPGEILVLNAGKIKFAEHIEILIRKTRALDEDLAILTKVELFCDLINRLLDSPSSDIYKDNIIVVPGSKADPGFTKLDTDEIIKEIELYKSQGQPVGGFVSWDLRFRSILSSSISDRLNGTFALLAYTAARVDKTSAKIDKLNIDLAGKIDSLGNDVRSIRELLEGIAMASAKGQRAGVRGERTGIAGRVSEFKP